MLFQKIFCSKDHLLRTAKKKLIGCIEVDEFWEQQFQFAYIDAAMVDLRFGSFPAQDMIEAEPAEEGVFQRFKILFEDDGIFGPVAIHQREFAFRFRQQGGFDDGKDGRG